MTTTTPTCSPVENESFFADCESDLLEVLKRVNDPEIGINIVDLGLVYRAQRTPEGIDVAITLSTPSCPLGESIIAEAREILEAEFSDVKSVRVELVWDPPWTPERMTEAVRQQFK
jgi:metal-sulfur cluster biosynthetic enzyme